MTPRSDAQRRVRRLLTRSEFLSLGVALALVPGATRPAKAASRDFDPATVLPMDKIPPAHRAQVSEVIREHTLHKKGAADTFPCNPKIYMGLLNEPTIPLALWQDLATSPARLRKVGPGRYSGSDGAGTMATWEYVLRSPKLHVLLCDLNYSSPRGAAKLDGRIVLLVHSGFYKEVNGEHWVQHDIEAFVKVDSKGWKMLAKTIRPMLERVLEDQVQEAGLFVSLMGRLVEMYPNWASSVVAAQQTVPQDAKVAFCDLVTANRRPGAFTGRPVMVDNARGGANASAAAPTGTTRR